MPSVLQQTSSWVIALFIVLIPLYAAFKRVKVYEAFVEGAKEGFGVAVRIVPYLVAILSVIGALRASGGMETVSGWLSPLTERLGVPAASLPLMIVRPLSGGAARGVLADILQRFGPDSYTGRVSSVMSGSTETTFYVLAVYFGAVGISRFRHALPAALIADLCGFSAAVAVTLLFFGN